MSLIRKPDIEVFRDSSTVTALRNAKTLAEEGGRGAARAISNIWLSLMLVVFIATGLGAMTQARSPLALTVCALMIGAAIWALFRLWRAPTRSGALESGTFSAESDISVPLPEHLRDASRPAGGTDSFHIKYWPRAIVNQATIYLLFGAVGLSVTLTRPGMLTLICLLVLMRGLMLVSMFLRGGSCVTATAHRLTVRSLTGQTEMLWGDITNVHSMTFPRNEWWVQLTTGSRHHIIVSGYHRLGNGRLLIPYKLLGLDDNGVWDLIRRLRARQEAAGSAARELHTAQGAFGQKKAAVESAEPQSSFDPDAIIKRYLAERDQKLAVQQAARELPPLQRPAGGFGRKRVGQR